MASVVSPSPEDFSPRASLALETLEPPSSSPFPSPSSSFLPPPVPGVHEFAAPPSKQPKRNSAGSHQGPSPGDKDKDNHNHADSSNPSMSVHGAAGENASRNPGKSAQLLSLPPDSPAASPITPTLPTPTPALLAGGTKTPTPSSPITLDGLAISADMGSPSLSASRPAPPSPAPSRRSSAILHGSSLSRRSSKSSTRPPASNTNKSQSRLSQLSSSLAYFTPSSSPAQSAQSVPDSPRPKRRSLFLAKIRDFAFPPSDERHCGKGPDVPRPNRYPKRMSTLSYASSSTDEDDDEDGDERLGKAGTWGGFKWGFGGGGWGFGNRGGRMPGEEDLNDMPSQTELARNFSGEEEEEESYEDGQEGGEEPLYPGLYKALYAFVPEGTAEMALEEEQVVRVIGRGGGVGWAVVARPEKDGGGHALVPESYLEPVKLDDEED